MSIEEQIAELYDLALENPDVRNGKEVLIFEKELDGCCFVLKELRRVTKKGKQNRLMLQTFYIKKKTY
jgi:hypothetical protein